MLKDAHELAEFYNNEDLWIFFHPYMSKETQIIMMNNYMMYTYRQVIYAAKEEKIKNYYFERLVKQLSYLKRYGIYRPDLDWINKYSRVKDSEFKEFFYEDYVIPSDLLKVLDDIFNDLDRLQALLKDDKLILAFKDYMLLIIDKPYDFEIEMGYRDLNRLLFLIIFKYGLKKEHLRKLNTNGKYGGFINGKLVRGDTWLSSLLKEFISKFDRW